jgi:rfaE bifunctional protein kinase chain/domain
MNKKVFVYGSFNILHPGHIRLLHFAKECGKELVVGVFSNMLAGDDVIVDQKTRLEAIKSLTIVDKAFIVDDIFSAIENIRPNVIVKGREHEKKYNPEIEIAKKIGCEIIFSSGENFFSSAEIINSKLNSKYSFKKCDDYLERHKIKVVDLLDIISEMSRLKVCVIGDLIVDEYITSEAIGMSREEPSLVVTPISSQKYVGGAGIVAMHGKGLGANVSYICITGDDLDAQFVQREMQSIDINYRSFIDPNRPTTLKQRYKCEGRSLLRVNHFHQSSISSELQRKIFEQFVQISEQLDLIILSDFNYGLLPDELINKIINFANQNNIFIAADCQSSSQVGDISKYKNVSLITPTEYEARVSLRSNSDSLIMISEKLLHNTEAKNLILKLIK